MNYATIQITQIGLDDGACIIGNEKSLIALLHKAFREAPDFKAICTSALLTFDTEAGGETMNLEAATAEKEEQP